jgi:hopanoid biosynthesis associated protein HpnK
VFRPAGAATPRVIVTADDFGLTDAVNDAVELAYRDGILTHASLMVAGAAASGAMSIARRLPGLSVGLHVVAIEGPTVLPPAQLGKLAGPDGWLRSDQLRLGLAYGFSQRARARIAREIDAQFRAFAATGLKLAHADAHKHMHLHPFIGRCLIESGRRHGLRRVRVPAEPPAVMRRLGVSQGPAALALHAWTSVLRRQVARAGMTAPNAVFGLAWTGQMIEPHLLAVLREVARGGAGSDVEIYTHPATHQDALLRRLMPGYRHAEELAALLSPAARKLCAR